MLKFKPMLKFEQIKEGGSGGAFPVPPKSPSEPSPAANDPPSKEEGDNFDELGYEKAPAENPPPKEGAPVKEGDKTPKDPVKEEVKDPATGYGAEPPKVEDAPPAPPEPPPVLDDLDKVLAEVPKEDAAKFKDFAKKHNMTLDAAKDFVAIRKQEVEEARAFAASQEKQWEREKAQTRVKWYEELKADPTFGGAKMEHSISQAEKVLNDFLPRTKKGLTERKAMANPDFMRDLAELAGHLYSTERLTQGEPIKEVSEEEVDDGTAFYNS